MQFDVKKVKIFVTIPTENVSEVRNALGNTKAGIIGNYTHCTYSVKGVGTFKPNDSANPHIGQANVLEFVSEDKLEIICNVEDVKETIKVLRSAHPYEEPGIDIVPLLDEADFI